MKDKISVIIPVYNAESTLEKCVESLVYGEYKELEIILIEDCSIDASWKICEKLSCKYDTVTCFQNSENRGVSYTRNYGLGKASGNYILFVDSDDWVSGRYVELLFKEIKKNPQALIMCGFEYIDVLAGKEYDYLWSREIGNKYLINKEQFFELPEKVLLQQLWNKIFIREIIEKNNIKFDEELNMGEDFQFVLDYMKAFECSQCVVINEKLYYYIRANTVSLMSKFGLSQVEIEIARYAQLRAICGENSQLYKKQFEKAEQMVRLSHVYQICRSNYSKDHILEMIEAVMIDGKAKQHYHEQMQLRLKEHIKEIFFEIKKIPMRITRYFRCIVKQYKIKRTRMQIHAKDFTILSQNCIGGVFYHDMNMKFLSPTINLYFKGNEFVRFVHNLEYYISMPLEMKWGEKYPIGVIDDIKIYFMHYATCRQAQEEWEKRKKRIDLEKIIVLCTDMEGFDDETYDLWAQISYPKVLFSATNRADKDTVFYSEYESFGKVSDLIPERKFYKDDVLISVVNTIDEKTTNSKEKDSFDKRYQ